MSEQTHLFSSVLSCTLFLTVITNPKIHHASSYTFPLGDYRRDGQTAVLRSRPGTPR